MKRTGHTPEQVIRKLREAGREGFIYSDPAPDMGFSGLRGLA
jgi:hypothetical protein